MEKAAGLFKKAGELNPADYQALVHFQLCLNALNRQEEARKVNEDALRLVERHIELYPGDARALYLGAGCLFHLGQRDRCLEWASRALAIDPEETSILYNVACTYSLLGEKDRALELLEKAARNGFGHKEWIENDPDLVSLRDQPRFQALINHFSSDTTKFRT
jgi:adenylate cyclase